MTARRDPFLWIAVLLAFAMLAGLSVARYQGYNTGTFDLGNMSQAIWSATQGQPLLYSRPEGLPASRLAGHVELGYYALVPFYALWPDPRLLLIVQAGLFALGAVGAYRLTLRRTESRYAARCITLIYLLYPTAITSVLFDFHADTLVLPLLMLALDALDQRAWRRYALLLVLALSLKFYVAIAVAGIGFVIFVWYGQRRAGAITMALALLYGLLAFFVIRPLFATSAAGGVATATTSYTAYYFGAFGEIRTTLGARIVNAVIVLCPLLLVGWRGWRWLLPGLPIAAAALLSTGPGGAYDFRYHHYAIVVPFLVMAAIEGLTILYRRSLIPPPTDPRIPRRRVRSWRGDLGLTTAVTILFAALLTDIPLNPLFWIGGPGQGLDQTVYGVTSRDAIKDRLLARIPAGAPVAASNFLSGHLTNRSTLYLLRYPDEAQGPQRLPKLLPQVEYAVADALFDYFLPLEAGYAGGIDGDREAIGLLLNDPQFGLTGMQDGLLLFERGAATRAVQNTISSRPDDGSPAVQQYGDAIALVQATVVESGPGRLRLSFTWRVTGGFGQRQYLAVSRLRGSNGRIVHLPGYALRPSWQWRSGELIDETFEAELPEGLQAGSYELLTGWYDLSSPYALDIDERSRLPGSSELVVGSVSIR